MGIVLDWQDDALRGAADAVYARANERCGSDEVRNSRDYDVCRLANMVQLVRNASGSSACQLSVGAFRRPHQGDAWTLNPLTPPSVG